MGTEPLELRTTAMLRALEHAREAVPAVAELDETLGDRFTPRFNQLAGEVQDGLTNGGDRAAALKKGEDLVAETLAFLGGAAARKYKLDGGVTSLADAWLDQLSHTATLANVGVVIPASTEFTGMLSHVVRLRLPSDGIWSLPVAVHEYGHFVASVLTVRDTRDAVAESFVPVEELAHGSATKKELPRLYWHGHELFADALAAWVAGPAYTRYCLEYRFAPAGAQNATATHPEPVRRIRIQLSVFEKLAPRDPSGYLKGETDAIREKWTAELDAAGVPVDPEPDADLDPLEKRLIAILDDPKLAAIRYVEQLDAEDLANRLMDNDAGAASVPIALNAAWVRRRKLKDPDTAQLDAIAAACERLVRKVLGCG